MFVCVSVCECVSFCVCVHACGEGVNKIQVDNEGKAVVTGTHTHK